MNPDQTAPFGFILFAIMMKVVWCAFEYNAADVKSRHLMTKMILT